MFLNGGTRIGKTFIAKSIYHGLVCFYNKELHRYPLKINVIIVSFLGRVAHIANDIIVNSTFHFPLGLSNMLPLSFGILDTMSKEFEELRLLLVYEVSLMVLKCYVTFTKCYEK